MMEEASEFFNNLREHPALAGLVIAGFGLIMLIAAIMDADWLIEGGNGTFNIAWVSNRFGRKTAQTLMGILSVIIMLSGLLMYWGYSQMS